MNEHSLYIENLANKAIESVGSIEPPTPLNKIADKIGLKIVPFDFSKNISAILKKDKKIIGVNKNHSPQRQRFSIAHEIGHFLLNHDIQNDFVDNQFDKSSSMEREANVFASFLLMPTEWVKNKQKTVGLNIPAFAKDFKVSEQAMTIKLLELGLIK